MGKYLSNRVTKIAKPKAASPTLSAIIGDRSINENALKYASDRAAIRYMEIIKKDFTTKVHVLIKLFKKIPTYLNDIRFFVFSGQCLDCS